MHGFSSGWLPFEQEGEIGSVSSGEPVFDKLPALLAHAMMSLPASKGFEVRRNTTRVFRTARAAPRGFGCGLPRQFAQIGEGFGCASMKGSLHNDAFRAKSPLPTNNGSALPPSPSVRSRPCLCFCEEQTPATAEQRLLVQRAKQAEAASRSVRLLECASNHAGGTLGGITTGNASPAKRESFRRRLSVLGECQFA